MIIRTMYNSIKEGLQGILRHPLVTLASMTTILLMLLLMSAFVGFSANARYIMKNVGQQPPIEVYMNLSSTETDRAAVAEYLSGNSEQVLSYEVFTPEQNYNQFKANLGENASVLDNFDYNLYLPYTFSIKLVDPSYADEVVMRIQATPGVRKVVQEQEVMVFLARATKWVNIGTASAFAVLFLISLFIISNMVRISVYARATEISIMKYIGATNAYIRMPYVIEGAIVGLLSSIVAWGISCFVYSKLYAMVMSKISANSFYAVLPTHVLSIWILAVCAISGILIGAVGSGISVRKYIKV